MKRMVFVAIVALVAACGGKKTEGKDKDKNAPPPITTSGPPSGAPTPAGSAAPAPTMAGSAAPAPTMAGSAAPAGSAAAATAAVEVPSAADYEDKAKTEITDKNTAAQLDDIEKELGN